MHICLSSSTSCNTACVTEVLPPCSLSMFVTHYLLQHLVLQRFFHCVPFPSEVLCPIVPPLTFHSKTFSSAFIYQAFYHQVNTILFLTFWNFLSIIFLKTSFTILSYFFLFMTSFTIWSHFFFFFMYNKNSVWNVRILQCLSVYAVCVI